MKDTEAEAKKMQGQMINDVREIMNLPADGKRLQSITTLLNRLTIVADATLEMEEDKVPPVLYATAFIAISLLFAGGIKDEVSSENKLAYIQTVMGMTGGIINEMREGNIDGTETVN